jgi:hypothetical protein
MDFDLPNPHNLSLDFGDHKALPMQISRVNASRMNHCRDRRLVSLTSRANHNNHTIPTLHRILPAVALLYQAVQPFYLAELLQNLMKIAMK